MFNAQRKKSMQRIRDPADHHLIARLLETFPKRFPLIPQRIILGGQNQRPRHPRQIPGQNRSKQRILPILRAALIQIQIILHLLGRQEKIRTVFPDGRKRRPIRIIIIGRRINQNLALRHKFLSLLCQKAHGRRQISPGAVSHDRDIIRIDMDQKIIPVNPPGRLIAVVKLGRKAKFRRQPVIHRRHNMPRTLRHHVADPLIRIHTFRHPSPSMEKQQHGKPLPGPAFGLYYFVIRHKNPDRNIVILMPDKIMDRFAQRPLPIHGFQIGKPPGRFQLNPSIRKKSERRPHRFIDRHHTLSSIVILAFLISIPQNSEPREELYSFGT